VRSREKSTATRVLTGKYGGKRPRGISKTDVKGLKWILHKQDGGCGPESSISR